MTQPSEPTGYQPPAPFPSPPPAPPGAVGWRGRTFAVVVAALVLVGAGVGVGMAVSGPDSGSGPVGAMSGSADGKQGAGKQGAGKQGHGDKHKGKDKSGKNAVDPARSAWSHKYGVDRSTMPILAPAGSATAQQQAAATDLLERTEAATAQYSDLAKAKAAGYDLQADLARKEKGSPKAAARLRRVDAGGPASAATMPMLHVGNKALKEDGKVLDPNAPETLMYGYEGDGKWKLMGVMYIAAQAYPQAPPDPAGPITRWHYHDKSGARSLMMHLFFVPGNDLAHAFAAEMS